MTAPSLHDPLTFAHGATMNNRFMLAPLTNCQSHADGTLSEAEHRWLVLRAQGGFGLTLSCAAHVQAAGQAFPGQLGIFSDRHLPGLTRLAADIRAAGSLALVQLHHGGTKALPTLTGTQPVAPSADAESGARALSTAEVEQLIEDFVAAALRADSAGFDGVELHGAHSYILCRFLSPTLNQRTDRFGGSLENRARVLFEVVAQIRARCRPGFVLGVRLSPERFGVLLPEMLVVAQRLIDTGHLDFIDFSLWDCFKAPEDATLGPRPLIDHVMALERRQVRLGVAGKVMSAATARRCLAAGADMVVLGRAAILHHDYPKRVAADADFVPVATPVTPAWLAREGLSPSFVDYMRNWQGFVADEATEPEAAAAP